jgi:hypothetical protein
LVFSKVHIEYIYIFFFDEKERVKLYIDS